MHIDPVTIQSGIAVGLVMIYSWSRYNTPSTARSETTWGKFAFGRLAYVGIVLGAFGVLLASPGLAGSLGDRLASFEVWNELGLGDGQVAFPLIVALALTVFLSEVPYLSRADRVVRAYFHRVAAIPKERRRRIAMLRRSRLVVSDEFRAEAVKRFQAQGLRERDLTLESEDSPESLWTRLTIHALCLEQLSKTPKYAAHLVELEPYEEFLRSYDRLAGKAQHILPLTRAKSGGKAVVLLREAFVEQAQELLSQLYDFLSRLILSCERTERQRRTCMASLGLDAAKITGGWSLHELLWLLLMLMASLSVSIGILGGSVTVTKVFGIALGLVSSVVIGVAVHSPRSSDERSSVPPVGRYFLAGSLAFAAWAVIRGILEVLASGEVAAVLATGRSEALASWFGTSWPWSLLTVTVAVVLCALTDDWTEQRIRRARSRFDLWGRANPLDGLVVAAGMAAVAYFLVHPSLAEPPSEAPTLALAASGVGFLLGLLVPVAYRARAAGVAEVERRPAEGPLNAPTVAPSGG